MDLKSASFPVWLLENRRMLSNWNEPGTQKKSYFSLFMQCFTHYAVFLSIVGHFSELFRHCDKPNVSVTQSLADFYNWIIGNREALNQ